MELFTWWPVALLIAFMLVALVLQLVFWARNPGTAKPRGQRSLTHRSETDEGQRRHAERMNGLRALAEDIDEQESDEIVMANESGPKEHEQAHQGVNQEGHW